MKIRHVTYRGHPGIASMPIVRNPKVWIDDGPGHVGHRPELPLRLDLYDHSPTGFEWGYSGSGPAQLALAILADHFDRHPSDIDLVDTEEIDRNQGPATNRRGRRTKAEGAALALHQKFKAGLIANLPRSEQWDLTSEDVTRWIEAKYPPLVAEARRAAEKVVKP